MYAQPVLQRPGPPLRALAALPSRCGTRWRVFQYRGGRRSRRTENPSGRTLCARYVVRFAVWALAAAAAISCPRASSPASRSNIDSSVAWFGVMAFAGSPAPCTSTKDGPPCCSTTCTIRSDRSVIPNFARASFLGNVSSWSAAPRGAQRAGYGRGSDPFKGVSARLRRRGNAAEPSPRARTSRSTRAV
jgi:hypothetical protein